MKFNRSILFAMIGTAIALVLFIVVVVGIGVKFQESTTITSGNSGATYFTNYTFKLNRDFFDLAKLDGKDNFFKSTAVLWVAGMVLAAVAFILSFLRMFLLNIIDIIFRIIALSAVAFAGVLMIGGLANFISKFEGQSSDSGGNIKAKLGIEIADYIVLILGTAFAVVPMTVFFRVK